MGKIIEKLGKKYRHRRIRRMAFAKFKPMLKRWGLGDGSECGEQGEGALDTQELNERERMRRKLKKTQLEQCAEAKREMRLRRIQRREGRWPQSL